MSDLEKQVIPWGTAAYVSLPTLPMYLRASPDPLQATAPKDQHHHQVVGTKVSAQVKR